MFFVGINMEVLKSFIKKLKKVSPYKNKNLSIEDRFKKPEIKGYKWRMGLIDYASENFLKQLIHFYSRGYLFTRIEPWRDDLIYFIDKFTTKSVKSKDFDEYTKKLLTDYKHNIKEIRRKNRDDLWITLKGNRKIHVVKLTSFYPDIINFIPELESEKRHRKCHSLSRKLALEYYVEGMKADIVTGEINHISPKEKYLHSWVETKHNGKNIILDVTKNIVMKKEDYKILFDAKELERIDNKTLYDEQEVFWDLVTLGEYYSKLYLSCHDEAIQKWREAGFDKMTKEEKNLFYDETLKKLQEKKKLKEQEEVCE